MTVLSKASVRVPEVVEFGSHRGSIDTLDINGDLEVSRNDSKERFDSIRLTFTYSQHTKYIISRLLMGQ